VGVVAGELFGFIGFKLATVLAKTADFAKIVSQIKNHFSTQAIRETKNQNALSDSTMYDPKRDYGFASDSPFGVSRRSEKPHEERPPTNS
jgi:hypothetical protein